MRPGEVVWAAREWAGGVEVGEARVMGMSSGFIDRVCLDGPLLGVAFWWVSELHATRTAALEALAERLEESAREDRRLAAEFITRAEQRLVRAEQAKRMAGER